jgi:hypothetical protein
MTVREVQNWQDASVRAGSKSSAVGGYQIIRKTLRGLVSEMGLTGDEIFDNNLQDRLGTQLLKRRGFDAWQSGKLSDDAFMNNLAGEWAALPMPNGRSRYAGDGLNASGRNRKQVSHALAATRNGEEIDLSGIAPENQRYVASGAAYAADQKQQRVDAVDPMATFTGADMSTVAASVSNPFTSQREEEAAAAAAEDNKPGYWEGFKTAVDEQWVATALMRQMGQESFAPVAGFQYDETLWDEVSKGLPEQYLPALEEAHSPDHARAIGDRTRASYERDSKLSQLGWAGVGMNLGAAILDPVAILATVATEGALGGVIYGAKATKLSRFLMAGTAAGAVNAGVDGYLASQDPVASWEGVAYSAAAGFLLGGTIGAFRKSPVDQEFGDTMKQIIKDTDAKEAALANTGSVGAARNWDVVVDLTDAQQAAEIASDAPVSTFAKWRIDTVGILGKSENPLVRKLARLIDEDAVGGEGVSIISANEKATRIIKNVESRFYTDYNDSLRTWAKTNNIGVNKLWADPGIRAKFNSEVGMAVRRPLDSAADPSVQKVAARVKKEYAELLKYGKEHNIKGFQDLDANDLYLTRQHNIQALDDFMTSPQGVDRAERLFAKALVSGNNKYRNSNPARGMSLEELDFLDAKDMAKAYLKSIRSRKYQGFDIQQGLSGQNLDTLGEMLLDSGISLQRADEILAKMRRPKDANSGKLGIAKYRMILDEEYVDEASGIKIEDFLENDVEALFNGYTNSVVRTGALEEAFSIFKKPGDDHAPSFDTLKRYIAETNTSVKDVGEAEMRRLDNLYKAVKGIPLDDDTAWNRGLRRVRSFNFMRVMGQLGVAQLAELGMIMGNGGLRGMVQHMPAFNDFVRMASKGPLDEGLNDELEAMLSVGNDVLRHSPSVRLDDGSSVSSAVRDGAATKTQKMDFMLNQGKQMVATISGMSTINRMLQRLNARVLTQRFLDHANGARSINMKRFHAMGIDEKLADRISAQMRQHVKSRDGLIGKKVTQININSWDDLDAKNAFINGMDRWSRRSVQENSVGTMPAFMSKELGKSVGQFRSFMLGAYTKQVLAGIHHRDIEVMNSFLASMFFGGLFYVGQTALNSVGRPDSSEWLEKRLSTASIAKASFQRSGYSVFFPSLIDLGASPFTDEPIFAYRTTELSNEFFGNPTLDLIDQVKRGTTGALRAAVSDGYDFSQQDARAVASTLPFQNAFIIRNGLAAIMGGLPRFSQ